MINEEKGFNLKVKARSPLSPPTCVLWLLRRNRKEKVKKTGKYSTGLTSRKQVKGVGKESKEH